MLRNNFLSMLLYIPMSIFFPISTVTQTKFEHTCTPEIFDQNFETNFQEIYNFAFKLSYESIYKEMYAIVFRETKALLQDKIKKEVITDNLSKEELKQFYKTAYEYAVLNHLDDAMEIAQPFSAGCENVPELSAELVFHDVITDAIKGILMEIRHAK